MCGRFRLSDPKRFEDLNDVRLTWTPGPRFNVAPTQLVSAVLDRSPSEVTAIRWGLIPWWAKERKIGSSLINARSETVATKPAFREAYRRRRCLIPADGFYEWQKMGTHKVPHHILMNDGEPFAFAGLWESWQDPEGDPDAEPLRTCAILTGEPNSVAAQVHDRMPVILPRERYKDWLAPDASLEQLASLLQPFPSEKMRAYPISSRVNSPRYDDPTILDPAIPLDLDAEESPRLFP